MPGEEWRDVGLDVSFRSTAPVLALVDAVFADPAAAQGVTAPGALRHIADRAGHAGSVELWPLAPPPEEAPAEPWTVPRAQPRLDQRAAAPGRGAGRLDRRRDRRRHHAGKPRPGAAAGRRAGARAPPQRVRPRAGARAEGPQGAGGRAGPAGADRPAGGRRPAGAVRRAAAARGRSATRLRADQPARRPVRRQPDGAGGRAARARCGPRCARAPASGRTGSAAHDFIAALLAPGGLCLAARAAGRGARPAGRAGAAAGAARAGGGRADRRVAGRRAGLRAHPSAGAAGLPALAAPVRRRGEARGRGRRRRGAHHDGARRQGPAGAAGDPARHHRPAAR